MELDALETFLQVVRSGSINRAAEALFLAQSTVTHRLQKLEKELGMTLFIRTGAGVTPTADGQLMVPEAEAIVSKLRSLMGAARQGHHLNLVAAKAFITYDLPPLLGAYRRAHPDFTCYVRSTLFDESVNALLNGMADAAFLGSELYHPQIEQVPLPSDPVILVVAAEHPWASRFPGFAEWGDQPIIAFGTRAAPFRSRVDRFLAEQGLYPPVIMELDSVSAVARMVMQNLGVAMLPSRTVREAVQSGALVMHDVSGGTFSRPTLLAIPKQKAEQPRVQAFVAWVQGWYAQQPAHSRYQ